MNLHSYLDFVMRRLTKLLLNLRNKLCQKLPFFAYTIKTDDIETKTNLRHDNNSYSCKVFKEDKLDCIRTGKYDFSQTYNVKFDEEGKRIYSLFVNDYKIILNHKHCLVTISLDNEDDVHVTVQQKGNSYVQEE